MVKQKHKQRAESDVAHGLHRCRRNPRRIDRKPATLVGVVRVDRIRI